MSLSRWQARLACRWSVNLLFPDLENTTLFADRTDVPHHWQSHGYLWTFTFPDEEAQTNHKEALERWRHFANWLQRGGKRCVRALERGGRSGHYHFHAITDQRWPIAEILEKTRALGFGRIGVEEVPRDRVYYVAKYIGKPGKFRMPKGVRLWACVGFKGVSANNIFFKEKSLTVPTEDVRPPFTSVVRWEYDGVTIAEKILRPDWSGQLEEVHTMKITKENTAHLAELLAKGSILAVAEYRIHTAREMTFEERDKKTGQKTGKVQKRKLVEHGVEVGNEQITVTEWLPDDANISDVKPLCQKGEPCVVEISGFSKQYGITAKSIKPLANFDGKLS